MGNGRIASQPVLTQRSRNAFPSFRPMIASASDGDFGSGGVATATYAMKLAIARTFLSNVTYAVASSALRARSSSAVRAASAQNVTAEPSGIGACLRADGVTVR